MELFRLLGSLIEPPTDETSRLARLLELGDPPEPAAHTDLFLFQLFPFASVYLSDDGKIGGDARDRIAGFWRALGLEPPPEPDHLTLLLAFYAELVERERNSTELDRQRWSHVRRSFLWEHLLSWLPAYLDRVGGLGSPFYQGWAGILAEALTEQAAAASPPPGLPLHLRQSRPLPDPRSHSSEGFLDALTSPLCSGLILTRSDLERAGRELGLGVRRAERTFVLKALLGQDDAATLEWLSAEARRFAAGHRAWEPVSGRIALFWSARATATAELLTHLVADL